MEKIFDIAKDERKKWGDIAAPIDANFTEAKTAADEAKSAAQKAQNTADGKCGAEGEAEGAEVFNDYGANTAAGKFSHAEGEDTAASGEAAHAEGYGTEAAGYAAHAEGYRAQALQLYAHAEGKDTDASGQVSHAEGFETVAGGTCSHAEGRRAAASGTNSHAEGTETVAGNYSHAEGYKTKALGQFSHAEGSDCVCEAAATCSHAEGFNTKASAPNSHAEGNGSHVLQGGDSGHCEGCGTWVWSFAGHAEGNQTQAWDTAHAEGYLSQAQGTLSHAGGYGSHATGYSSFAHGLAINTVLDYEVSFGKYNANGPRTAFSIGFGTAEDDRRNALEVTISGNTYLYGVGGYNGTNADGAVPINQLDRPTRATVNMNDCLQTGFYPWCTLGRPEGCTGAFSLSVRRASTPDGNGFYTVEQTCYGREAELGQVWTRMVFDKGGSTSPDTDYMEWIRVDGGGQEGGMDPEEAKALLLSTGVGLCQWRDGNCPGVQMTGIATPAAVAYFSGDRAIYASSEADGTWHNFWGPSADVTPMCMSSTEYLCDPTTNKPYAGKAYLMSRLSDGHMLLCLWNGTDMVVLVDFDAAAPSAANCPKVVEIDSTKLPDDRDYTQAEMNAAGITLEVWTDITRGLVASLRDASGSVYAFLGYSGMARFECPLAGNTGDGMGYLIKKSGAGASSTYNVRFYTKAGA